MRFSVLIPVYNTEKYLDACINSVLSQTFNDFEIIIVDDGSKDNSGRICDNYEAKYPETIKVFHQTNKGLISARRVAVAAAKGEFCIFVDSDDFIERNLLEIVNWYLNYDKDIDMIIYSYYYYSKGKKIAKKPVATNGMIWNEANKTDLYKLLSYSCSIDAIWIKAIKTELLLNDPIHYEKYENQNMSEDLLQSLYPITFANRILYLDLPLYDYRYNEQSISRCFDKNSISKKNSLYVYNEIKKILPVWSVDEVEFMNHINARWFNETMYIFFNSYEKTKNKMERNEVLTFNWNQLLPDCNYACLFQLLNSEYYKVYLYWLDGNFKKIHSFFKNKTLYRKYKSSKKVLGQILRGKR